MTHTVTNNHDAPLNVAGVTIAGNGGTAGVEADALRGCLNSNGTKTWLKLGLIEIDGLDELQDDSGDGAPAAPSIPGIPGVTPPAGDEKSPERVAMEEKAAELGVKGVIANMKDDTLTAKIAEAEAAANGGGQ